MLLCFLSHVFHDLHVDDLVMNIAEGTWTAAALYAYLRMIITMINLVR